jgi:GNAT superfamily N-acetyltransferase
VLIADADGHPVGFCTVYLDILSVRFGQRSWIEDLAVHPDRRSQSIGRRLMTAAQDWDANAALPTWNWTPATTAHERTGSTKAGSRHRVPSASAGPSDHATAQPGLAAAAAEELPCLRDPNLISRVARQRFT